MKYVVGFMAVIMILMFLSIASMSCKMKAFEGRLVQVEAMQSGGVK